MRGFDAVKLRHHVIHQYEVVHRLGDLAYGGIAAESSVDLHIERFEQSLRHRQVDRIVVHDEDFGGLCGKVVVLIGGRGVVLAEHFMVVDASQRHDGERFVHYHHVCRVIVHRGVIRGSDDRVQLRMFVHEILQFLVETAMRDKEIDVLETVDIFPQVGQYIRILQVCIIDVELVHISLELDLGVRIVQETHGMARRIFGERDGRFRVDDFLGDRESEGGTFSVHTLHGDVAVHE